MIKRTFQTLKQNPIIILGFLIPMALVMLIMLPMFFGENSLYATMMNAAIEGDEAFELYQTQIITQYLVFMGIMILGYLVIGFLYAPPLLNKVYEVCAGIDEPDWIARGLKKSWWKVVVTVLILGAAATVVVLISLIIMLIPIIGALAYMAAIFALAVFALVAYAAVIAESDYGTGLANVFRVGTKMFWKELGTIALTCIPVFVIGIAFAVIVTFSMINTAVVGASEAETLQAMMNMFTGLPMLIYILVICIYYGFAGAFLYTYTMHQYLDTRDTLNAERFTYDQAPNQKIVLPNQNPTDFDA